MYVKDPGKESCSIHLQRREKEKRFARESRRMSQGSERRANEESYWHASVQGGASHSPLPSASVMKIMEPSSKLLHIDYGQRGNGF